LERLVRRLPPAAGADTCAGGPVAGGFLFVSFVLGKLKVVCAGIVFGVGFVLDLLLKNELKNPVPFLAGIAPVPDIIF